MNTTEESKNAQQSAPRPDPSGPVNKSGGGSNPLALSFSPVRTIGPRILIVLGVLLAGFLGSYVFVSAHLNGGGSRTAIADATPTVAPNAVSAASSSVATNPTWYKEASNSVSMPRVAATIAASAGAGSTSPGAPALPPAGGGALPGNPGSLAQFATGPSASMGSVTVPAILPGSLPASATPPPHRMTVAFVQPQDFTTANASGTNAADSAASSQQQQSVPVTSQSVAQNTTSSVGQQPPSQHQANGAKSDYLENGVESPRSMFELQSGAIIPCVLTADIVSDLQGFPRAIVSENVYDSIHQQYLVIPQGSHLVGTYVQGAVYGQNRIFVVWTRLFYPDGRFIDLNGMHAVDQQGSAGLNARVDKHTGNIVGNILLLSALQAGFAIATTPQTTNVIQSQTPAQAAAVGAGTQLTQLGTQMTQQALSQAPTLTTKAGARFGVMVEQDIVFTEPYTAENP